jgi:hypothetical protein
MWSTPVYKIIRMVHHSLHGTVSTTDPSVSGTLHHSKMQPLFFKIQNTVTHLRLKKIITNECGQQTYLVPHFTKETFFVTVDLT